MTGGAVLVTGGTGFVGSAVLRALLEHGTAGGPSEIRVLTRRSLPPWMSTAGVVEVRGDLTRPSSLRGVARGVGTVVHLATRIGGTLGECLAVNADGTRALLDEVRAAAVRRVINVSTTAVYGNGVHRGISESMVTPNPVSATSASRLAAERAVRAAGGVVLRPHLLYGPGDRWFVPTLVRLLRQVPAWIDGGRAMTSLVAVDDLARIVAALVGSPRLPRPGAVFHASHPQPASLRTIITMVCGYLGLPLPEHDLPVAEHRALTRRAMPELTDHQHALLSADHWYASQQIWRYAQVPCGPSPTSRLSLATPWYREVVTSMVAGSARG